ncbi:SDR family NAD(P)-dependent oxidoreductase [Bradyrhizobium ottawaense]|uniref:SDR family NAD(P)-dependent oxidoreductase n=1 Tax=Bradyrhizobium ottawaense TaxID=931866 RepID=UPI00359AA1DF
MDLGLKSKTAVVTGASIGIGRAIAKGLAAEGVRVVGVARRTDLLAELVKEEGSGLITPLEQDVMAKDAAERIAAFAVKELGHVDILINNAGGSRPLPVDAPDSKWDEAIALNFTSYRRIAHALLPQMIERKWGRIVNITGKSEPEGLNAAFAAKAAVHAWAKGLSREIGEHGITINCIPPGRIMSEQIRRNYAPDYRERFGGRGNSGRLLGRAGRPRRTGSVSCLTGGAVHHGHGDPGGWRAAAVSVLGLAS